MEDRLTARPRILKQANLSLVRKAIRDRNTATRAEIAEETRISSTTVRSLLSEMMQNGEIESIGYDESSGGRKAERYRFRPDRYYGAALCMEGRKIYGLLVNICGEIVEATELEIPESKIPESKIPESEVPESEIPESEILESHISESEVPESEITESKLPEQESYSSAGEPGEDGGFGGNILQIITSFLDDLVREKEIRAIGVGVPGIVEGGSFLKKSLYGDGWYRSDLGDVLSERYHVPVVMENNLNATAIGFGRCYLREFPEEKTEDTNMAYLHLDKGCVSAGFIAGGRILRGNHNFAGELGLIPMEDGRMLENWLDGTADDTQYTEVVTRMISWICGILNPRYVALGGPGVRKECIGAISDALYSLFPKNMFAEILYSPDVLHDYQDGMAYLTAGRMFDEVQFTKEIY